MEKSTSNWVSTSASARWKTSLQSSARVAAVSRYTVSVPRPNKCVTRALHTGACFFWSSSSFASGHRCPVRSNQPRIRARSAGHVTLAPTACRMDATAAASLYRGGSSAISVSKRSISHAKKGIPSGGEDAAAGAATAASSTAAAAPSGSSSGAVNSSHSVRAPLAIGPPVLATAVSRVKVSSIEASAAGDLSLLAALDPNFLPSFFSFPDLARALSVAPMNLRAAETSLPTPIS
mmetsp:Transcript_9674/g.24838  ORF Transcript_9674/g.24838 Transcript_9674/m.24838 type:complete len:235 (+) Transcript_9674:1028-1732(+)